MAMVPINGAVLPVARAACLGARSRLRIIRVAIEEWLRFGGQVAVGTRRPGRLQVVHHGSKEQDADTVGIVGQYWQNIGLNYDGNDRAVLVGGVHLLCDDAGRRAGGRLPSVATPHDLDPPRHPEQARRGGRGEAPRPPGNGLCAEGRRPRLLYAGRAGWNYAAAGRQARGASHSDIVVYSLGQRDRRHRRQRSRQRHAEAVSPSMRTG